MNMIVVFTDIIVTFATFALLIGLIMLCRKQWRKRGIRLSLTCFGVIIIVGTLDGALNPKPMDHKSTLVATQANTPEQSTALAAKPKPVVKPEAAPIKEDPHKAKLAVKVRRMTDRIVSMLRQHYDIEPKPLLPNRPFCREGSLNCNMEAGPFSIQVYGAGIVKILTTPKSSHANYREMCTVVFSAISGSDLYFAEEAIAGAFTRAAQMGSFEHKVADTQITVKPGGYGVLGCSFFKYGD